MKLSREYFTNFHSAWTLSNILPFSLMHVLSSDMATAAKHLSCPRLEPLRVYFWVCTSAADMLLFCTEWSLFPLLLWGQKRMVWSGLWESFHYAIHSVCKKLWEFRGYVCSQFSRYCFQFTATLAYTITDYKCQGDTYGNSLLSDLQKPLTGSTEAASLYVQLSRVQSLWQLSTNYQKLWPEWATKTFASGAH